MMENGFKRSLQSHQVKRMHMSQEPGPADVPGPPELPSHFNYRMKTREPGSGEKLAEARSLVREPVGNAHLLPVVLLLRGDSKVRWGRSW